jgi:hypothetical protein
MGVVNRLATVQAASAWIAHSRAVVNEVVVIDIRNVRDIGDARIGDIHPIEVTAARAIPRDERLTKSQRAPTEASAETESKAGSPTRATEPCH